MNTSRCYIIDGSTEKIVDVEKIAKVDDSSRRRAAQKMAVIFCAELFGTGTLMFIGCAGVCTQRFVSGGIVVLPQLGSIGFGLAVLLCIQSIGHISGAHLNPQVTLAAVITRNMPLNLVPIYLAAEFLGALAGFGLLTLLWPVDSYPDCSTVIHPDLSVVQGIAVEVTITCVLIIAVCSTWDTRNKETIDSTPIRIGLIVSIISLAMGLLTGASMNSARTFAPALILNKWENHWVRDLLCKLSGDNLILSPAGVFDEVYWIGPTLGSIIGSIFYKYVLAYDIKDD